ncbi:MAG: sigma-70 family RNA polymerase sigma factor [Dehalococcoidia bacterium]
MTDGCNAGLAEEATLIDRARRDPEAFGVLYDRHLPRVYRYVFARCSNHTEAEDLTAQTFHRALERFDTYEWRGLPFAAWLFRIAHNLLVDRARRGRDAASLDGLGEQGFEPAGAIDGRTFDDSLMHEEAIDAAWLAVRGLPPMQRRAVTLYFSHGLSHAEVGRTIGRSETATKQLVYRAVQTLRSRLAIVEGVA